MVRKVIVTNISLFLFLAVIAELIFGNWIWGHDYGMLNIPRNVSRSFDTKELYASGGQTHFTRDEHGLRGPYDDVSQIDILTIGGSTTNQIYIDDRSTWQSVLRHRFNETKRKVTIVNAAVDGQSTRGHLKIFDEWFPNIPNLKAKYILAYVGINDVAVNGAAQYDSMINKDVARRIRHWISNNSALYNFYRILRGMFAAQNSDLVHGSGSPFDNSKWVRLQSVDDPTIIEQKRIPDLNSYRRRLEALVEQIRVFGAEPILVTQPTAEFRIRNASVWNPESTDGGPFLGGYLTISQFNEVTLDVCRELGGVCIDLAHSVEFTDGDFYDRIHNTPKGTEKIGRYLFNQLSELF